MIFFFDGDQDGYGQDDQISTGCVVPDGYVQLSGDCDDLNPNINPNIAETCDEIDNNCNDEIDESSDMSDIPVWYLDYDGDGYGNPYFSLMSCSPPENYVVNNNDCDDLEIEINPMAIEICDERNNDCDNETDEGVQTIFYRDEDGDGWGVALETVLACSVPSNYAENVGDCDDNHDKRFPLSDRIVRQYR